MNASELRKGNWVLVDSKYFCIENLEITGNEIVDPINPYPIPLTPEILEKAGFAYDGTYHVHSSGDYRIYIDGYGSLQCKYGGGEGYNENAWLQLPSAGPLKTLHQLQNLYFALVGEELQITLP